MCNKGYPAHAPQKNQARNSALLAEQQAVRIAALDATRARIAAEAGAHAERLAQQLATLRQQLEGKLTTGSTASTPSLGAAADPVADGFVVVHAPEPTAS